MENSNTVNSKNVFVQRSIYLLVSSDYYICYQSSFILTFS